MMMQGATAGAVFAAGYCLGAMLQYLLGRLVWPLALLLLVKLGRAMTPSAG